MNIEQKYLQSQIENSTPIELVVMLYDGCIRFLKKAKIAIAEKDIENSSVFLMKSRNIITELMSSLNTEEGGEIANNLLSLYVYVYEQLVFANIYKNNSYLEGPINLLQGLHEAWTEIASKNDLTIEVNSNTNETSSEVVTENSGSTSSGIDFCG